MKGHGPHYVVGAMMYNPRVESYQAAIARDALLPCLSMKIASEPLVLLEEPHSGITFLRALACQKCLELRLSLDWGLRLKINQLKNDGSPCAIGSGLRVASYPRCNCLTFPVTCMRTQTARSERAPPFGHRRLFFHKLPPCCPARLLEGRSASGC